MIVEPLLTTANAAHWNGGGKNSLVETPDGVLYCVYVDTSSDVSFRKSIDKGISWGPPTTVYAGTVTQLTIWYDRWSGISGDLIHCAYSDSAIDDILYRSIDAGSADALGTQTTVFLGSSTLANGNISITRTRGGNVIVAGAIDAGTEDGAWESNDVGATWAGTIADPSEGATGDQYLMLPGWNADTQDAQLIFWDASAEILSVKRYDDSANSWAETTIATSMTDSAMSTAYPHFDAAVDLVNSQNIVVAWSNVDVANSDLRCWKITDSSITEVTNVVLNSTDDQGLAAISIDLDTGYWYVFYVGASDGSETWPTAVNVYYKVSKDQGSTWGPETQVTADVRATRWLATSPRIYKMPWCVAVWNDVTIDEIIACQPLSLPSARSMIGI